MSHHIQKLKNLFESNASESSPPPSLKNQNKPVTPKSPQKFKFPPKTPTTVPAQNQKFKTISSIEKVKFTKAYSVIEAKSHFKLFLIENCDSVTDAIDFLTMNFEKMIHKFLIFVKIRQQWNEIKIDNLNQKLKVSKIPQVFVFENEKNLNIFINFNGLKTLEKLEKIDQESFERKINFVTFLRALKSNICGTFADSILRIKIDEKNFKKILKISILNSDIILLNFLKLFDINFEIPIDNQNRVLEIASSIPNSLSFFSLVNDNREKFPTTSTLKTKSFDKILKLKNVDGKSLIEIAMEAENFDICEFLISTKYFKLAISDILEDSHAFHELCVGKLKSSENFNKYFLLAKFMIEHILKADYASIEDEFDTNLRLRLFWHICSEMEDMKILGFLNSYLMTNFEPLENFNFEFLREFIKSKFCDGYLSTLKRKLHRTVSKVDAIMVVTNFFDNKLDYVAKLFIRILESDVKILIKNSSNLIAKIIDSEIFEYFWENRCEPKLKMTILTTKSDENFSNLVKIIKKFHDDEEKLSKFYSGIEKSFKSENIEKFFKKRCGYDEEWTHFEEIAINILKFVPNAIENFKIFFKFAQNFKITSDDRIELFAKLKTQVKYEMSTPICFEMLLEYFDLIETKEEKSELLNHVSKNNETILNEISWQVDENLLKKLFKIIKNVSHDPRKFLDSDKFGKNVLMKVCHSHYGKNVELIWKFIKKICDEDQRKELLLCEDVSKQKAIFYGLIIPHNDDGNGQVKFLIDLYLKYFTIDEVKNFVIAKNSMNETIVFLAMKRWGKVNETFWNFVLKNFKVDEIKRYLGERNTLGYTAFCKSEDLVENMKIMDRNDLNIVKYIKDQGFKMEDILELVTVKYKEK
ncbi:hypothetical protein PVAND_015524 [Polypedilum vanderplanki]|uniref:Uncharacterized protein n=1 Tax=Polypedilum vanderplanki TaxID=319348 RepID=A0A9J6BCE7_POLVA|nr:hypothetical protein PVAND_015524 [Polypedilum vanderplanki]